MAEKQEQEQPLVVVIDNKPTPKDQLVSAGIQLGIALAIPAAIAVAGAVVVGGSKAFTATKTFVGKHKHPRSKKPTEDSIPETQE